MYQKRVVKKKVLKKKVAQGGPRGRGPAPAIGGKAPQPVFFGAKPKPRDGVHGGYQPPSSDAAGLGFGAVILFVLALALLGGVFVCFVPPDMSGVDGFALGQKPPTSENLLRKLDDAITAAYNEKKEATLIFTEEDLNGYLNQRLQKNQQGPLGSSVEVNGVYCDLQPDTVHLYVVRSISKKPLVIYSTWAFEGDPESQIFKCQSCGIGAIKVDGPSLQPILAPFLRLRMACARELGALQEPTVDRLRIEDGKLVVHVQP